MSSEDVKDAVEQLKELGLKSDSNSDSDESDADDYCAECDHPNDDLEESGDGIGYICPDCRFHCDKCNDFFLIANKYESKNPVSYNDESKRDFTKNDYCYGCCCVCNWCGDEKEYPSQLDNDWKCTSCDKSYKPIKPESDDDDESDEADVVESEDE